MKISKSWNFIVFFLKFQYLLENLQISDFFKNVVRIYFSSKSIKESWTTHQNSVLSPLRILKNDSSCSFPPWGWSQSIFWMDKWCFKIKTRAKMMIKNMTFDQKCMEISKSRFVWPEVYGNFEIKIYLTRSVWKFTKKRKTTKDVIDSLPQAPFHKQNVQHIKGNMRISKKTWKTL